MAGKVIVIAGPTASGKTALSISLARLLDGEIVSADSMQVYRGMDIGTAKASPSERASAVHHMLDVADPDENYSVARYVEDASLVCDDILSRGKVPLITGGTGLYIDSLLSGRTFSDIGDRSLRDALGREYDVSGGEVMLEKLRKVDPERAALLPAGDRRRIVRALEIYQLTGITITEHDKASKLIPPRYDALRIVLGFADRATLYSRIDSRVDAMEEAGLFEEVASLLAQGVDPDCTAMQAIGYKEPAMYLRGELCREDALALIKQSSRRYAKRQLTWFNRWEGAVRINRASAEDIQNDLTVLRQEGVI